MMKKNCLAAYLILGILSVFYASCTVLFLISVFEFNYGDQLPCIVFVPNPVATVNGNIVPDHIFFVHVTEKKRVNI